MCTIDLFEQTGLKMLGTRPAARVLEPAMRKAVGNGEITLNTSGIQRIGVSFFDESLLILSGLIEETGNDSLRLIFHKAPPLDSLRNLVPKRGLILHEAPSGDWIITAGS